MDKTEKLLKKISPKDRALLRAIAVQLLQRNHKGLQIKKLKNSDFYRARERMFRIIFHYEKGQVVIDSVCMRKKDTYRFK